MAEERMPLISAIIISYNSGEYLYQTIESTLNQDYPNIELLISDDHSPEGFDADRVIQLINERQGDNIKQVIVRRNETNLGTVRNIEEIRKLSHGDVEMLIAGDDCWHDGHVFTALMERFRELGPDAEWVTSQIEMCDETLTQVQRTFIPEHIIALMNRGCYQELLNQEMTACYLPGSGCAYKRSFFEKIGALSDTYRLVEDYPTHIRALRMGIPVYYANIISVKHRSGGVSSSNQQRSSASQHDWYTEDLIHLYEHEVEPYPQCFSADALEHAKAFHDMHVDILNRKAPAGGQNVPDPIGLKKRLLRVISMLGLTCFFLICTMLWNAGDGVIPKKPVLVLLIGISGLLAVHTGILAAKAGKALAKRLKGAAG